MAVSLVTTVQHFAGLSGDTKPTVCPVGSTFWASDTNVTYVTHDGGSTWSVGQPLASPRLLYTPSLVRVRKTVTFTGAAGNGAQNDNVTLFTITGRVFLARFVAYGTALVSAGGGKLSFGTASRVVDIQNASNSVDGVTGWIGSTATVGRDILQGLVAQDLSGGAGVAADIITRVTTGDITGGTLTVDAWYAYATDDGALVGD